VHTSLLSNAAKMAAMDSTVHTYLLSKRTKKSILSEGFQRSAKMAAMDST
jgi:hypothetical protein